MPDVPRLRPALRDAALAAPPDAPGDAGEIEPLERAFSGVPGEDPARQFDRQWALGLLDRVGRKASVRESGLGLAGARDALWAELLATAATPLDVQEELGALTRELALGEAERACAACGAADAKERCPRCLLAAILETGPRRTSDEDALFGELAVSQGLCGREQVEECRRVLDDLKKKGVRPLPRLGGLLLQKGFLGQEGSGSDRTVMIESKKSPEAAAPAGLPSEAAAAIEDPKNLVGKYVRVNLLGVGGMGEVWRAWDRELKRWVALKFLKYDDPKDAARFRQEAEVAAGLTHPNLCAIYEVGRHEGRPFLAMQYVEGCTLDRWPGRERHVLVRILRDAARAAGQAHRARVIHRDFKPANIMIDADGRAFVMDFGLARRAEGEGGALLTREIVGTPNFMSPEQAKGGWVDVRSDVYSLGATLYASLTRKPPFQASSIGEVLVQLAEKDPVPPRKLNPRIERDLETIVLKAMEKKPERRYATADELADDLERWLQGEAVVARPPGATYRLRKALTRHRKSVAVAAVTGVAAMAVFAVLVAVPEHRRAREDHAALAEALRAKREIERRFAEAVEKGRHDEAVELARAHAGKAPDLPRLHADERADHPDYAHLRRTYELSAARAHYERGVERLRAGDPRGKGDLANAYRAGKLSKETRPLARDALLRLTDRLLEEGDARGAEGTARLAAGLGLEHASVRAALARSFQRTGQLEEAAGLWHSLEADPALAGEAARELELLRALLPRAVLPRPEGRLVLGDLDLDGALDLLSLGPDRRLRLFRPGERAWIELGASEPLRGAAPARLAVVDFDGRGRRDVVVAGEGEIRLLTWDGAWRERARGAHPDGGGDLEAVDLDGDGRKELVGTGSRALHVYAVEGNLIRRLCVWPMACEVNGVRAAGGDMLLVWLGEWLKEIDGEPGWRLGASELYVTDKKGKRPWGYRIIGIGRGADGWIRERAALPARVIRGGWFWADPETMVVVGSATPHTRKVVPEAKLGLFRARWSGGAFGAPEEIRAGEHDWVGPTLTLGGTPHLLIRDKGVVTVLPSGGGPPRRFGMEGGLTRAPGWTSPGLVVSAGEELRLYGHGTYAPPPLPKLGAAADKLAKGEASPVQELLDLELYEEAAAAALEALRGGEDPALRYELGLALLSLRRWDEAAEAFDAAAAARGRAGDALLRRARALEAARRWRDLEACLEKVGKTPGVDPSAREWAAERLGWARRAGRLEPRGAWIPAEGADALLCDNPFRARLGGGGLDAWGVSGSVGDAVGLPLVYDGEGLRFTIRFRAGKIEWATDAMFGMELPSAGGRGFLGLWGEARGAGDLPVTHWRFGGASRDGRGAFTGWGDDEVPLKDGEEYAVRVEYVEGPRRAFAEILDAFGNPIVPMKAVDLPAPLERGTWLIGRPAAGCAQGDAAQLSAFRILKVEVEGSPATGFGGRSEDLRRKAGGALTAGRAAEAAELYATLLKASDDAGLRLFRALALFRDGKREGAAEEARRAFAKDREACARLLRNRAAPALTLAESGFLLRAAE